MLLGACCLAQTRKYLLHGLNFKDWNPDQYLFKLMDYDDEEKPLNFIAVRSSSLLLLDHKKFRGDCNCNFFLNSSFAMY